MIRAVMWERYRAEIELSLRAAELTRAHREELHLREVPLHQSGRSRRGAHQRYVQRSAGWLLRAARTAASWIA
ncbi:MAG: hypothetical protein HYU87_07070 [Chloroflexi bacterium]|nr:hypothetical protein [Chloroflexota bacterium]